MAVGAVTVAVSTVDEVVLQAMQFSAVIKSGNQNQGKNYVQTGEHKNRKKKKHRLNWRYLQQQSSDRPAGTGKE